MTDQTETDNASDTTTYAALTTQTNVTFQSDSTHHTNAHAQPDSARKTE